MSNDLFDCFNWNAKQFYTAPELEDFLHSVKVNLIEKPIDKILVMGHIYTSVGIDEHENRCVKYSDEDDWFIEENRYENEIQSVPTHRVSLSLDEPIALCFGDLHFEINYCEFSNAQIGINTLMQNENISWQDVSNYFAQNIIGQKLVDIKINYTSKPNEYVSHYRKIGEKMYDEIIFVFENGHQLEIASDIDYMSLIEVYEYKAK